MICPSCKGKGDLLCHINTGIDSSQHRWERTKCFHCEGVGHINDDWFARGKMLKQRRLQLELSLLDASILLGLTLTSLCSMELGKSEPLSPDVLDAVKNKGGE